MSVYEQHWDIGAHTAFSGRICDTLWTAINYGMYTTQFFMGNPKMYNRAHISEEDIIACKKILKRFPTFVVSHFPYTSNLAGSVKSLAWNGDKAQDKKTSLVLSGIEHELNVLAKIGGLGVVIHPGAFPNRKKGLDNIAKSINRLHFTDGSKLLLENAAGQGNALATTLKELKTIIDGVTHKEHIGVCIDTCHLHSFGEYDLKRTSEIERFFSDFETELGMGYFSLLHLNDSETRHCSRVDRHACIGTGSIWSESTESLVRLLDLCKEHNIPILLETHGIDMLTLSCLK